MVVGFAAIDAALAEYEAVGAIHELPLRLCMID
jgi:hypothetical protein